ncbi:uncharacterized protein LOC110434354 [Sorghum bicolor]|uniref:uncharacterized protein LOC110434354 n=1 Tax=Sorghum bicolor TaxID=4558 RepID=UPI000B42649A|nr:uncharacterized protein LOC110434354 [Sorghum bicolor]|eukprot:XP_021313908.1 uncharacterized protein LOC110434354 [Sorghum bicolor]
MAAHGNGGFGHGFGDRDEALDLRFQPGFNPRRGGRGVGRGFAASRGRGRNNGYNFGGRHGGGAQFHGGGRAYGGYGCDRSYGGWRGRDGWHQFNYGPHPPPQYHGVNGLMGGHPHQAPVGHQFGGAVHQVEGGGASPQGGEGAPVHPVRHAHGAGGHLLLHQQAPVVGQQGGGAPQVVPAAAHQLVPQQAPNAAPQGGGVVLQAASTAVQLPPPQQEAGVGLGGGNGAASNASASAMVVDSENGKATENKAAENPKVTTPSNTVLDIPESSDKGAQKNKGKPFCYRCRTKGHTIHECTVALCCAICFGEHVTKLCQNLKKTNVNAIRCGYAVEGLGFYYIPVPGNPKVHSDKKLALVRVLEGPFTVQDLAVELERLLPGQKNHNWGIELKGNDAFIINFPHASILDNMVNWGAMDAKAKEGRIRFEKGIDPEVYKYEIGKVWVQFRGLPKELKNFPIIWAIGTILSVPRAVDMVFTNNTGRCRMKVVVLASNLIPDFVDVVIGDQVYSLQFKIEENPTGEPQVIDMDSTSEEDPKEKENEGDDPKDRDTIGKAADGKMDVDGAGTGTPKGDKQKASETGNANNKTVVLLPQQEAAKIILQSDSGVKDNTSNGGVASPGRSSKRNVSNEDQDSLEKASRLKASKNLETPKNKGTISRNALAMSVNKLATA